MQNIQNVIKGGFSIEEVGEKECEVCGNVYKLYKTPRGELGACKPCSDKQVIKDFNLPTAEEYRKEKELQFIASFERVNNDLRNATVNSYRPDKEHASQLDAKRAAIKFVKEFEENKSQSLVFAGTPGLGKSHLAYAISKAIKDKGYKVLFIKSTHLLDHFRNTYKPNSNIDADKLFKMISELDLLVLDDLGGEYVKESDTESWASDIFYKTFDDRLDKAMVVTTNYSENELINKYGTNGNGARIMDRMLYNANAVRIEGPSYRRKTAAF